MCIDLSDLRLVRFLYTALTGEVASGIYKPVEQKTSRIISMSRRVRASPTR